MAIVDSTRVRGFSLIEVMIAVVVLSFGMLALASMQGGLFRAGAETKARANATAFAQRHIEDVKTFGALNAGTVSSYEAIATQALTLPATSGTQFYGCAQVRRYRYDVATSKFVRLNDVTPFAVSSGGAVTCADTGTIAAGAVSAATPEFKEVKVSVGWFGDAGQLKSVEIADSVAAISPSDAIMLAQDANGTRRGPVVWIRPPNIDEAGNIIPAVVPIGIGGDQAAASSNPKPEQFVDDVSSATLFSVLSFTGSGRDEVLLNRKIDVAAASCVCADTGGVSSITNPAYQPTVWNGKQLAYMEPATAAIGKKVGAAVVSNSDGNIRDLCTTCCRDHHDSGSQALKVDPYRPLAGGAHTHYGYQKQGNSYNISGGLFAVTSGEYVEACRLIRVGGIMRVAVDGRQSDLMVTPLNAAGSDFNQLDFIRRFSDYVGEYVNYAAQNIPANYPGATATYPATPLPAPTVAQLTAYSDIVSPPTIQLLQTSPATTRKMVAFGLYVDYLTPETLAAYNCARTNDNTGACLGLGTRNPLEYIPFYAVNVANLGNWQSKMPTVVSVVDAGFNNQGSLASDGGTAKAEAGSSVADVPVGIELNNSNSGLTSTAAVDPDDGTDCTPASVPACTPHYSNYVLDMQNYMKTEGSPPAPNNKLFVKVGTSSTVNKVSLLGVTAPAGVTACNYSNNHKHFICSFEPAGTTVRFAKFTDVKNGVVTNRKICYPTADARITSPVIFGDGTIDETFTITIGSLGALDYTLKFDVIDQNQTCPTGAAAASLTP